MTEESEWDDAISVNVAQTIAIRAWLDKLGFRESAPEENFAVDLADILAAASEIERQLKLVLVLDPRNPEEANRALLHLGIMDAHLFTELKGHLATLELEWAAFLERVADFAPDDAE